MSIGYTHISHTHTHEHMPEKIGTSTGNLSQRQALSAIKQMGCSALAHPQLGLEAGWEVNHFKRRSRKSWELTHTHILVYIIIYIYKFGIYSMGIVVELDNRFNRYCI